MICPNCGAKNSDSGPYCTRCGNSLVEHSGANSQCTTQENATFLSFEDALYEVLSAAGTSMLRDPRRFLGLVSDQCDHSSKEYKVFEYNCNDERLRPFAEACDKGLTNARLDTAKNSTTLILNDRGIEPKRADSTIRCICRALGRSMDLDVSAYADARSSETADSGRTQDRTQSHVEKTALRQPVGGSAADCMPPRTSAQAPSQFASRVQQQLQPTWAQAERSRSAQAQAARPQAARAQVAQVAQAQAAQSQTAQVAQAQPAQPQFAQTQQAQFQPTQPKRKSGGAGAFIAFVVVLVVAVGTMLYALPSKLSKLNMGNVGISAAKAKTATISYAGGGAKGKMKSVKLTSGEDYTLPDCAFSRSGYEFIYWLDANGYCYNPGDTITAYENTKFTAQWIKTSSDDDGEEEPTYAPADSMQDDPSESDPITPVTPVDSEPAEPTPSPSLPDFSHIWNGTYDGEDDNGNPTTRDMVFEFTSVSDSGALEGNCYVRGSKSGSSTVAGNIDWNTGDIYLHQTGWIDQGDIGPEREYRGNVDFANGTMSGYLSTLGADNFDVAWRCSAA